MDLLVPVTRSAEIVHERRGGHARHRFTRYFNTSARFWLNFHAARDGEIAENELAGKMERDVWPASAVPANSRQFSKAKVPRLFFAKKFCNVFRSDAQRCTNTSVDALLPSAHNALTSLNVVLKANGRGPGKIPDAVRNFDA
jgi:plasmid maintenance system antidote protein VapI